MTSHDRPRRRHSNRLATDRQCEQFAAHGVASPAPQSPPFLRGLPGRGQLYQPQQEITKKLRDLIEQNAYQGAFEAAIELVSKQRLRELSRIHTLDQFYFFVDAIVTWMPELRVWEWRGETYHERTDYLRITQFYWYFNQPTLVELQSPVAPYVGEQLTPVSLWLREFAVAWGEFLDTEASAEYLASYKFGPEYAYQDYAGGEQGIGNYKTFNQWFSRTFRDICTQRPVAQPDNPRVIAFPAESTFVGQWAVSTPVPAGEPMPADASITVKHVQWPIPELLADSAHAKDFEGGVLAHSFLNVYDYHRQHAPASGVVLEAKFIPGQVYLEVALEPLDAEGRADTSSELANAVVPRRYLDAGDATGYQFVQCRGLMVLQTAIGKIAVLPMGMAQVSSVVFMTAACDGPQQMIQLSDDEKRGLDYDQRVARLNEKIARQLVGKRIGKGDMISTFLFGGSDIVMVFERRSNVDITAKASVHYPVRSQYAVANIDKLLDC